MDGLQGRGERVEFAGAAEDDQHTLADFFSGAEIPLLHVESAGSWGVSNSVEVDRALREHWRQHESLR